MLSTKRKYFNSLLNPGLLCLVPSLSRRDNSASPGLSNEFFMEKGKITTEIVREGERQVQKDGWQILATSRDQKGKKIIKEILEKFELEGILYYPNLLIEKDGYKFFVIFSEKERFPISKTKKKGEVIVSGIDWFKYKLAEYIEVVTDIQVGLMMYSKETGKLVMRQMNQLGKPHPWFRGDGCLLQAIQSQISRPNPKKSKRLEKVFQDPGLTGKEKIIIEQIKKGEVKPPILRCIQCYNNFYPICKRCIKGKHKKVKAMAIWEVNSFQQKKLTVQPQLFAPNATRNKR